MKKDIYEKLMKRIKDDYDAVIDGLKEEQEGTGKDISCFYIDRAYEIAHYNEVLDNFYYFGADEEDFDWLEEEDVEKILNYDKNFVKEVFLFAVRVNIERYNFFYFDDFIEIVRYVIMNLRDE